MPTKVQEIRPATGSDLPLKLTPEQRKKIDRFGELDRRLQLVKPIEEEHSLLKKEFQRWHEASDGAKPAVDTGNLYQIALSARRNERTIIDKKKAFNALKKALGIEGVIAAVDLPLTLIDKHIPESERKTFIHQEHSGYRTVDVVALNPAELEKAA